MDDNVMTGEIRRITILLIDTVVKESRGVDLLGIAAIAAFLGRAAYGMADGDIDSAKKMIEVVADAAIKGLPLLEQEGETTH